MRVTQRLDRIGRRSRGGFSLIEVIVALIVLTMGVLGMAATTGFVVRQTTAADMRTNRTAALQTVLERLRATSWSSIGSGSDVVGHFDVDWSSVNDGITKEVTVITVGPGLTTVEGAGPRFSDQVADTFVYRIIRP